MIELVPTHRCTPERSALIREWLNLIGTENFEWVSTLEAVPHCGVWLADGTDIPCLVVAYDADLESYSVLTLDGATRQYLHGEVK